MLPPNFICRGEALDLEASGAGDLCMGVGQNTNFENVQLNGQSCHVS